MNKLQYEDIHKFGKEIGEVFKTKSEYEEPILEGKHFDK